MSHIALSVALAYGASWSNDPSKLASQLELLRIAEEYGIKVLDTARHYGSGECEKFLGNQGLSSKFEIVTKATMSLTPGGASKEGILRDWKRSSEALRTECVAVYLLHTPDDTVPISETMEGIQALYLAGHFKEFGLSNFTASQVEAYHAFAKEKNYVLPTVYQCLYSLIVRRAEKELFPTLRRLGIRIQAYSSLASGFLVKTTQEVKDGVGNFDRTTVFGKVLQAMYGNESQLQGLEAYRKLCEESGVGHLGMSYRWAVWNSALGSRSDNWNEGDMVILGASRASQLREAVEEIRKGPLDAWIVERLEKIWQTVEKDAPEDNYRTYKKLLEAGLV